MPPDYSTQGQIDPPMIPTLRRFLPYLWPKDQPGLRLRIVIAGLLVLCAKAAILSMPFAYKAIVDGMTAGTETGLTVLLVFVAAYGLARFGQVMFDNLRNIVFEKVGQEAEIGRASGRERVERTGGDVRVRRKSSKNGSQLSIAKA